VPASAETPTMYRVIAISYLLFFSGCAALQSPRPGASVIAHETGRSDEASDSTWQAMDALLRQYAERWLDTPYLFGGASHRGVDCSGLIQRVYADALNVSLPRTTSEQIRAGTRVSLKRTRPGDLVFFEPRGKSRHAGIVLDGQQFLHASSSRGVMISPLDRGYWSQHMKTARRIVSADDIPGLLSRRAQAGPAVPDLTER